MGETPPGFREATRLARLPAVAWVSGPDGEPAMELPAPPPAGLVRGDGRRLGAAAFAAERESYCGAARRGRAAAIAIAFVFLALLAVFGYRWLHAKHVQEPFRRPWSRRQA